VLLRVVFIPFFMLCNVKPSTRSMPVVFNDYVYCVGSILMALTHGHFCSLVMMYAPRYVCMRLTLNYTDVHNKELITNTSQLNEKDFLVTIIKPSAQHIASLFSDAHFTLFYQLLRMFSSHHSTNRSSILVLCKMF